MEKKLILAIFFLPFILLILGNINACDYKCNYNGNCLNVGAVAAAGKTVNQLPLYSNVALRDPLTNPGASNYESGGATDNVISIWKVAAPAIDLLAPDIYFPESDRALKVLDQTRIMFLITSSSPRTWR